MQISRFIECLGTREVQIHFINISMVLLAVMVSDSMRNVDCTTVSNFVQIFRFTLMRCSNNQLTVTDKLLLDLLYMEDQSSVSSGSELPLVL